MSSFPTGLFGSDDSHALFRVSTSPEGAPLVEGWDYMDGERFKINAVVWDGQQLRFTSTMPSNSFVVHHRWQWIDGELRGWRSSNGQSYSLQRRD